MRRMTAVLLAFTALLASSRPVREADPMLTLESPIFYAIEIITDFKNFPNFPTFPAKINGESR
jgi:hypothetical protein